MESFIHYAQFDEFWKNLEPLTPYGKDLKQQRAIYVKAQDLEHIWAGSDCAAELLENSSVNLSRIRYFLKRLPRLRTETLPCYDEADIFEYKKFLANYHRLLDLLPEKQRLFFNLDYSSHDLEKLLNKGDQYTDTFYVADAYSEDLAQTRGQIRDLDKRISSSLRDQLDQITAHFGWTFPGDFAVIAKSSAAQARENSPVLLEQLVILEPFDGERLLVRPRLSGISLALQEKRQELTNRERREEQTILEAISEAINADLPQILHYLQSVSSLDMALARAKLVQRFRLQRPQLSTSPQEPIIVEEGRFIPCQEQCERLRTDYIPLDWRLSKQNAVLFGSNMGGKTIALKTLAFLQLCVQTGLYVPAQKMQTCLFQNFRYIGEGRLDTPQQGLSGFGYEISQFCEAYTLFDRPVLVLFDEFARTTNSREAEALISAILQDISSKSAVRTVFSSHFHGIARQEHTEFFKMRGLKREAAARESNSLKTVSERLQHISSLIDYRIQPDPETLESSDALTIAALLGTPAAITESAQNRLKTSAL